MLALEDHQLGETDEEVTISIADDHRLAATMMTKQASRTIDIISRELDPLVYDDAAFVETLKRFILDNRNVRIRIMVFEPQKIVRNGHRLIDLAMTLSSFVEIRKPNYEHDGFNESVFVADTTGYILRTNAERFEGKLNFSDKRSSRILIEKFDEMWEKARSDNNFVRLHI